VVKIKYAEGVYAEIDAILENGAQAIVVEVKTTLRKDDIDDHLIRMEKYALMPMNMATKGNSWEQ
jgi:Holliday junction resolvase-like predicted endonuclease